MVGGITAIRLISADAEALAEFYVSALGFVIGDAPPQIDAFCGSLRKAVALHLGGERIEICEPMQPVSTPFRPAANSTAFQHFAMVAPLMTRALDRLQAASGWTPITHGKPQALPRSSGGATAFKFRDPEGHPLELLTFPPEKRPARWRHRKGELVGIDHSAIVVTDTTASATFYAAHGFVRSGHSLNHGPEQAALDGLSEPEVEVTALTMAGAPAPHLELLCYKHGICDTHIADGDPLATRTICGGERAIIRDPDGHRWIRHHSPGRAARRPSEVNLDGETSRPV